MQVELGTKMAGVGALIVVPEDSDKGFLSLRELRNKRSTHKVSGMRSLPYETINPGETESGGMARLATEEIRLRDFFYDPDEVLAQRLCVCEHRPGVMVASYLLQVPSGTKITIGSESQEVADLRWTPFADILNAPKGDLGIRPGVREVVQSYIGYREDPIGYQPRVYEYRELYDKIPDEVFDLIEKGFSLEAALFRLNLASESFAKSVFLARSQSPQVYPLNFAEAK